MNNKAWCTCKVVVCSSKPIAFCRSRCCRPRRCSSSFLFIERLRLRRSRCTRMIFAPDQIRMHHSPRTTGFPIFNPERSLFSIYMIQEWMKFHIRTRISFGMKNRNELVPERLLRERNVVSVSCFVNEYREIYGDGMNSFQNKSSSVIMWIAVKSVG